jgi:hypothetical protein
MKKISLILLLSSIIYAGNNLQTPIKCTDVDKEQKKICKEYNKKRFNWLNSTKKLDFNISLSAEAMMFIDFTEVRNFLNINQSSFVSYRGDNIKYADIRVNLLSYNDVSDIYYGELTIVIDANSTEDTHIDYIYTKPIAGSNRQIRETIKEELSKFVRKFDNDLYIMRQK